MNALSFRPAEGALSDRSRAGRAATARLQKTRCLLYQESITGCIFKINSYNRMTWYYFLLYYSHGREHI